MGHQSQSSHAQMSSGTMLLVPIIPNSNSLRHNVVSPDQSHSKCLKTSVVTIIVILDALRHEVVSPNHPKSKCLKTPLVNHNNIPMQDVVSPDQSHSKCYKTICRQFQSVAIQMSLDISRSSQVPNVLRCMLLVPIIPSSKCLKT